MKVLQINTVVNTASTGRIAEGIGVEIINNGDESSIAFSRTKNQSQSYLFHIGSWATIYFHILLTRLFDLHGRGSVLSTIRLVRYIKKLNPDVIHLHNIHGYFLNYKILFKFLSSIKTPVVWTLHDCWLFTGHCAYFDYVNCTKWTSECNNCPQLKQYPASLFADNSKINFHSKKKYFLKKKELTLVPVSDWLSDTLNKSFLKSVTKKVIKNGIDLQVFKPYSPTLRAEYNLTDKFIILGVASVWERRKGLDDFVSLAEKIPSNYRIVLIGIPDKIKKILPKTILAINKTESAQVLAEWYSTANVFFNPTWEDNYPTTNLEAIGCGTPVITYDTGGSVEVIDDKTGYVVGKANFEDLLLKMKAIEDKGLAYYTDGCRKYALDTFDMTLAYKKYIQLYQKIINR